MENSVTLAELRKKDNIDDYEVYDEVTKCWTSYKNSCYSKRDESFPEPSKADFPINLITFYDNHTDKYYVYTFGKEAKNVEIKDNNVVLKKFDTEYQLLYNFVKDFRTMKFDIFTGWNSWSFDMPYIYNRTRKIAGDEIANSLSPTNRCYQLKFSLHGDIMDYFGVEVEGLSHLDYLILYKRFDTPVNGQRPSYSLNNIAKEELGYGKLEYKGNLKQLYKEDFQKFVEYNIQDVKLVVDMEKHKKFLFITRLLCTMCLIDLEKIFTSSALIIGSIMQFNKPNNVHLPYVDPDNSISDEKIQGAFVKEPIPSAYWHGVAAFDVQSLYPSIIISMNMSTETYVGKIVSEEENLKTIKLKDGRVINISDEKFKILTKDMGYTVGFNGAIFNKKIDGVIPTFLKSYFNKRIEYKSKVKKISQQITELKEQNGDKKRIEELTIEKETCDMLQGCFKIILNSTYGVCASKFSPFFNPHMAEAITLTGQKVITSASDFLEKYIKDNYSVSNVSNDNIIIYNDTDSCDSSTMIRTDRGILTIEKIYDLYFANKKTKIKKSIHGHDVLENNNFLKTYVCDNYIRPKMVSIKHIIRHKVTKKKYKIKIKDREIIVTEDHSCIVLRDNKLIEVKPNEIVKGDKAISIKY